MPVRKLSVSSTAARRATALRTQASGPPEAPGGRVFAPGAEAGPEEPSGCCVEARGSPAALIRDASLFTTTPLPAIRAALMPPHRIKPIKSPAATARAACQPAP